MKKYKASNVLASPTLYHEKYIAIEAYINTQKDFLGLKG